ncbi:MAG: MBL fold metallo-hydrolase [Bacteroidota bacterium]
MRIEATLLGTGTSVGVPVIGCDCPVCTSTDPRDARTRTSAHVVAHTEAGPVHLQIDAGPDFRRQALDHGVSHVDALLVTHAHFDHVMGLDDLRPYFFRDRTPIPVLAQESTADQLADMFRYIFRDGTYPGVSRLDLCPLAGDAPATVVSRTTPAASVEVWPVPVWHGAAPILGWRIGDLAYLTDVSAIPEESFARLDGVEVLVLDGLRPEPHPTHFSFGQAAEAAAEVGARETWLVHMTHNVLHADADAMLPEGVRLGYDGLRITVGA